MSGTLCPPHSKPRPLGAPAVALLGWLCGAYCGVLCQLTGRLCLEGRKPPVYRCELIIIFLKLTVRQRGALVKQAPSKTRTPAKTAAGGRCSRGQENELRNVPLKKPRTPAKTGSESSLAPWSFACGSVPRPVLTKGMIARKVAGYKNTLFHEERKQFIQLFNARSVS